MIIKTLRERIEKWLALAGNVSRPKTTMNESEYFANEMADSELDAIADAADFYLEESGFFFMPTQKVMLAMAEEAVLDFCVKQFRQMMMEEEGES